jgi:hypothetical protein
MDSTIDWNAEGFVVLIGPDNSKYLVPDFLVDSLQQSYQSYFKKKELRASSAAGTVSVFILRL